MALNQIGKGKRHPPDVTITYCEHHRNRVQFFSIKERIDCSLKVWYIPQVGLGIQ
ncbi:hypothetical protein JSMCR1_p399 (plasmid) [Escherichia coli]|nr:hypothetical protein JSMCR1_p399 [Escherichia coli]